MNFSKLFDDLQKGDELWWLDTYAPSHKSWITHLREAIQRGARINMLVLDPNCQVTDYRADEIGDFYTRDAFKPELEIFLRDLLKCVQIKSQEGGSLEIRIYSDLPCVPIYLICRQSKPFFGYTSFFLSSPTGVEFPHLKWKPGDNALLNHFYIYVQKKWDKNKDNTLLSESLYETSAPEPTS